MARECKHVRTIACVPSTIEDIKMTNTNICFNGFYVIWYLGSEFGVEFL